MSSLPRININEPRYDQSSYWGRAKHFFTITNPLNLLCSEAELEKARNIVQRYKAGENIHGLTDDDIWKAKHIYDSAFHPDNGEKMLLIGRMSAQVPMNMTITGCMMTFYNQIGISYVLATSGALVTALGLNSLVKTAPPLVGRLVPFAAVAAANCVNIPMMRLRELRMGIPIVDDNGNKLGESVTAAKWGITQVVLSRILMASPGMVLPSIIMNYLDKHDIVIKKYPSLNAPIQVLLCGLCLTFATPMCCALFPQKSSISVSSLEPELRQALLKFPNSPEVVYYNKGL